ncbi:MAG: ABC transporter permease [Bacillota bacterium]
MLEQWLTSDAAYIIIGLISSMLRMATPLGLAAFGAVYSERAGVVNLGLEGLMLVGAFFGVLGSFLTGNPWTGVVFSLIAGGVMALILAIFTLKFKANHVVSGVALNLLGQGITAVLLVAIWGNRGKSPDVAGIYPIYIPGLSDIPVIGEIFFRQSPFFYMMIAIMIISWFVFYRTKWGLRLRAIGENPAAVDSLGIQVFVYKYLAVVLGGMFAGLGGACLSLGELSMFSRNMVSGRGYIAVAATILGNWNPVGVVLASLLFGLTSAIEMNLQLYGWPTQFVQMLPYIVTILVLGGFVRKVSPPKAVGKHFDRSDTYV